MPLCTCVGVLPGKPDQCEQGHADDVTPPPPRPYLAQVCALHQQLRLGLLVGAPVAGTCVKVAQQGEQTLHHLHTDKPTLCVVRQAICFWTHITLFVFTSCHRATPPVRPIAATCHSHKPTQKQASAIRTCQHVLVRLKYGGAPFACQTHLVDPVFQVQRQPVHHSRPCIPIAATTSSSAAACPW